MIWFAKVIFSFEMPFSASSARSSRSLFATAIFFSNCAIFSLFSAMDNSLFAISMRDFLISLRISSKSHSKLFSSLTLDSSSSSIAAISGSLAEAFLSISDILIRFSKSLFIVLSLNLTKWIF